ncbi:hypothetical protein [Akkermansia sp.]|uniref:hypothetical protein n=1 Tax=Akkermansia sp. TaxID=1872421 RepID=UPI00083502AA
MKPHAIRKPLLIQKWLSGTPQALTAMAAGQIPSKMPLNKYGRRPHGLFNWGRTCGALPTVRKEKRTAPHALKNGGAVVQAD